MTLITADELARGALLITFGSAAGGAALAVPGSPLWLVPAAVGVVASAFTVPEVRAEVARSLPALTAALPRGLLPTPDDLDADDDPAPRATLHAAAPARPSVAAQATAQPAQGATRPAVEQGRRAARVLSPDEFAADPLFVELNAEPHRMIIGHSQGGKSTAMHAMVGAWGAQGQMVYVADPDAARGQWPGATYVAGYNEDYTGIGRLLADIDGIFETRSEEYAEGRRDFTPVHIVMDEVHETFANVPQSKALVDKWARRGAKRGLLVTLGTQDNHRDSLGFESAAVLNNFITAELEKAEGGKRQARVYRGNAAVRKNLRTFTVPPLPSPKTYMQSAAPAVPEPTTTTAAPARPAADTAQLVRREATIDMAVLARLAPSLAAKRGYTPTAQDNAALAAMLGDVPAAPAQSVTVERGGAGAVVVNVNQTAAGRPTSPRRRGVNVRAMRERADKERTVRRVIEAGGSANEAQRQAGINRKEAQRLARKVRGERAA
jgi:hypothetical protein